MLDSLHRAGIEIVSPAFMNQRRLEREQVFIPEVTREAPIAADESRPEERMFDKADLAEAEAKVEQEFKGVVEEIEKLGKGEEGDVDKDTAGARIRELEARRAQLEKELEQHKEQKKEESGDEEG